MKVAQSCPTLRDPMDYIGCGILQARILEWVAFPFSRGSFQPRDQTQVCRRIFYQLSHKGGPHGKKKRKDSRFSGSLIVKNLAYILKHNVSVL